MTELFNSEPIQIEANHSTVGVHQSWYDNGQLMTQEPHENGKLHGIVKKWFEDGALKYKCTYQHGLQTGECKQWHNEDQLASKKTYIIQTNELGERYSVEDGTSLMWYEDGVVSVKCNYVQGKCASKIHYNTNGLPSSNLQQLADGSYTITHYNESGIPILTRKAEFYEV